jgi:hypothetical protein
MARPRPMMPSCAAAARDRSSTRWPCAGWRSLIVTTTERPLYSSVTRTLVPSGRVGCAAVIAVSS